MHCPLPNHGDGEGDKTRSASVNVETGQWYCQACEVGGYLDELINLLPDTVPTNGSGTATGGFIGPVDTEEVSEGKIAGWHKGLLSNREELASIRKRRGLSDNTIERFQLGWDTKAQAYTIPIRDEEGNICNVRRYQLDPPDDRRKMWSVKGMGQPVLYPMEQVHGDEIIICEGEMDALLTIQHGFFAITRTGAADVWKPTWNELFRDKVVYLCHDMDEKGQRANRKLATELKNYAREIRIIELPYEVTAKHGKDLSDYWLEENTPYDFLRLLEESAADARDPEVVDKEFVDVSVIDSYDANKSGEPMRMRVTISGKKNELFMVPKQVEYFCTQDAGAKCQVCPMDSFGGQAVRNIESHDPMILEFMGSTNKALQELLRNHIGAMKCTKLTIEAKEQRSVEELIVRPAVDHKDPTENNDFTLRKIVSVGRYDSLPNNTVEVVGTIYPNPRGQQNEFQAWEVHRTETSVDKFHVSDENLHLLQLFQPRKGQRPLNKLGEIATDLSTHVTKIYGRREMHALMDLVFHSVLQFNFGGKLERRGWLDALIIGDTRTGKSEAAQRMMDHYNSGEIISCESASFAGVVGGLQQVGGKNEWAITWGVIPINDRRLVALDEVSGLKPDEIAAMSSIRSSGEAQLTKIRSERTWARTRLLWISNPRNGRMHQFTYGVHSIQPLIGNPEDIARFDLAMSVSADEVSSEEINRSHDELELVPQVYTADACTASVLWAWSRKSNQVYWEDGAEQAVYAKAIELGKRYTEAVPLVQAANVRVKIARVAVALAARTFSTDETFENLVVRRVHVEDAVTFINILYSMPNFGYDMVSGEARLDVKDAATRYDEAKQYLYKNEQLAKFLRGQTLGKFRRNDIEDMLNLSREEANSVVARLWDFRMITRDKGDIRLSPMLQELLREMAP